MRRAGRLTWLSRCAVLITGVGAANLVILYVYLSNAGRPGPRVRTYEEHQSREPRWSVTRAGRWGTTPSVDKTANAYLAEVRARCEAAEQQAAGVHNSEELCPCIPASVVRGVGGKAADSDWESLHVRWSEVGVGGVWRPETCHPRTRIAVLIPYHDNEQLLLAVLSNLLHLLHNQALAYRIVVIQQVLPVVQNIGALLNAGFVEAGAFGEFDCVLFHDGRALLVDGRNMVPCYADVVHLTPYLQKNSSNISAHTDGAFSILGGLFKQVNGFSNRYFSAKGLSTDLYNRLSSQNELHQVRMRRPPKSVGHATNKGSGGEWKLRIPPPKAARAKDGLSSLGYNAKVDLKPLVTWVSINITSSPLLKAVYPPVFGLEYLTMPGECEGGKREIDYPDEVHRLPVVGCRYLCDGMGHTECAGFVYRSGGCTLLLHPPCSGLDDEDPVVTPGVTTYIRDLDDDLSSLANSYIPNMDGMCAGSVIAQHQASISGCARACDVIPDCNAIEYNVGAVPPYWTRCALYICDKFVTRPPNNEEKLITFTKMPSLGSAETRGVFSEAVGDCREPQVAEFNMTVRECAEHCARHDECAAFVFTMVRNKFLHSSCMIQAVCSRVMPRQGLYTYMKRRDAATGVVTPPHQARTKLVGNHLIVY